MSYSIFLLPFVKGEPIALDAERFFQLPEPYVVSAGRGDGLSELRAKDGGEADLYHASTDEDGMLCVTASRFAGGAISDMIVRLAADLGAAILPQDGGALIFHENERNQLPTPLQESAVVIVPTNESFLTALWSRRACTPVPLAQPTHECSQSECQTA